MILCADPKAAYLAQKSAIDAAIARVLGSGRYILGSEVTVFEAEFAQYIGVRHGIGVANGTDAITIALKALRVGLGDEVITTAHTAVATVSAIELASATPVFADIEPKYFTLDPAKVEQMLSPRTKAIVAVHLYGQPADLTGLLEISRKHGIPLVEDCAQCHGARYAGKRLGSFGALAAFSCYPTKNLGALGDAGIIVSDDSALAERCRVLREYGWAERYVSHSPGQNSRLDELQAAVLRVKLARLDDANALRDARARSYDEGLSELWFGLPARRDNAQHVFHLYVVRCRERERAIARLRAAGVAPLVHYPVPIHQQPAYARRIRGADALPETERAAREVLSLPMYPELLESDVQLVLGALSDLEESE
ncbi:MAG TPA: DegT/DnrJ/EryC1/StrS family aminotransferase [Polyangiaceae bacterium]|nr:DegT/DnrJ/EryC1/StrS family aminotransferase [Polyangiaceae bacterium]